MADKKRNTSKSKGKSTEVSMNMGLLAAVLLISVVVIIFIAFIINGDGDDTDTSGIADDSDGTGTVNDVIDSDTETDDKGTSDSVAETDSSSDSETENIPDDTISDIPDDTDDTTVADDDTEDTDNKGNGDITIDYPTVNPDDGAVSDKLNALIKDYMDEKLQNELPGDGVVEYQYEVKSTETMISTDEIISILVKGEYYHEDSAHPTIFAYTLNCDVKTSSIITADNLIYDFAKVKKLFTDGKFTQKEGMDGLLDETNYEDMIMEYRTEYGIYPDVYFTSDSLGIVIELVYTLGGYATFEIPYSEVSGAVYIPTK